MGCCKACCGCQDCEEGQEGKCCCGTGTTATCCDASEYCCSGDCVPLCEEGEEGVCMCVDTCCPQGEYCCDGECVEEPCNTCGDCVTYVTVTQSVSGSGSCDGLRDNLQTITVPAECPSPVWVRISGSVDDDIAIDGDVVQDGEFQLPPAFTPCNVAHTVDYEFSTTASSFTIETVDNYAGVISADLLICFYPEEPPP